MKHLIYILTILAIASCSGFSNHTSESTTEVVQTETEAPGDISEKQEVVEDTFYTSDLAVFDLHGHVRTLSLSNEDFKNIIEFDRDGNLVKFTVKNGPITDVWKKGAKQDPEGIVVERDKNGRIKYTSYRFWTTQYTYDSTGRFITAEHSGEGGQENTIKYTRDANNQVTTMHITDSYIDDDPDVPVVEKSVVSISNVKLDEQGNWVSRTETIKGKNSSSKASRTITYWE